MRRDGISTRVGHARRAAHDRGDQTAAARLPGPIRSRRGLLAEFSTTPAALTTTWRRCHTRSATVAARADTLSGALSRRRCHARATTTALPHPGTWPRTLARHRSHARTTTTALPHAGTMCRRVFGKLDTALARTLAHALVMLGAHLFALFRRLCITHSLAVFEPFLFAHDLRSEYDFRLAGLLCPSPAGKQRPKQGRKQCAFQHIDLHSVCSDGSGSADPAGRRSRQPHISS